MPCQNITPVTVLSNVDGLPCRGTQRCTSSICLLPRWQVAEAGRTFPSSVLMLAVTDPFAMLSEHEIHHTIHCVSLYVTLKYLTCLTSDLGVEHVVSTQVFFLLW